MSITVPEGLSDLLQDFAIVVLREKPRDLIEFAAKYFTELHERAQGGKPEAQREDTEKQLSPENLKVVITEESGDMDDEDSDLDIPPPQFRGRRKSIFAEPFDPTTDMDVEKVIYPKTDEQRSRLHASIADIFIFKTLDPEQVSELVDAMFVKEVSDGEHVIDQGDQGDNFYIIDRGTFDILVSKGGEDPKKYGTYDNKGSFGELALMYNTPRAATIVATSDGVLWALDQRSFKRIVCTAACRKRETFENLLESVPMLSAMEKYERMNLADACERRTYTDGECIIKQGDDAEHFFLVESGKVTVTREDPKKPGEQVHLTDLTKGQYFGELALLTKKPRAASIHAVGDAICAVVDVGAFERLLGPCMDIMKRNIEGYEQQLMELFGTSLDLSELRQ